MKENLRRNEGCQLALSEALVFKQGLTARHVGRMHKGKSCAANSGPPGEDAGSTGGRTTYTSATEEAISAQ
eukprot:scaffold1220_cov376-Prasinococcus_capsulatus_cf.AAC.2